MSWKQRDIARWYAQLPTKIWLDRYRIDWVNSYKISERHVRVVKNILGANKRTQIRMCPRHFQYAECPDDVNIQQCHHRWHRCGYRTIWKTYPRPKNRMVQETAIKISDMSVCGFAQLCKHFLISMCFMDTIYCIVSACISIMKKMGDKYTTGIYINPIVHELDILC